MITHITPESQARDGSPGALQSVRISDAHTGCVSQGALKHP